MKSSGGSAFFLIPFGTLFACVGIFAMMTVLSTDAYDNRMAVIGFCMIFVLVGLITLGVGVKQIVTDVQVKSKGTRHYAKVCGYESDNFYVNGRPGIKLQLRFFDESGKMQEASVSTGTTNEKKYPFGSTVTVYIYNDTAVLDKKSSSTMRIEREEELMSGGARLTMGAPGVAGGMMVIACPGCSGQIAMVPGTKASCPFCGRIVGLTNEHMIV
ncbi:MAG: hypothetical protein IJ600_00945 [Lachnospiraceae bacterium]|nr:hypothetical protein [Lachnospiraceae bacterium]